LEGYSLTAFTLQKRRNRQRQRTFDCFQAAITDTKVFKERGQNCLVYCEAVERCLHKAGVDYMAAAHATPADLDILQVHAATHQDATAVVNLATARLLIHSCQQGPVIVPFSNEHLCSNPEGQAY
jgi:hypothetical protein